VEAESQARVFLRFLPALAEAEQGNSSLFSFSQALEVHEKNIEIYVNCRLVKDYQKTIHLKALCSIPHIHLPVHDCTFRGNLRKKVQMPEKAGADDQPEWDVKLMPEHVDLYLGNNLSDQLIYQVVNDSAYFSVDIIANEKESIESSQASVLSTTKNGVVATLRDSEGHMLRVIPNISAILKDADLLRRV
jgi:hypothetical protein